MDGKGGGQTYLSQTSGQKRKREEEVSKYGQENVPNELLLLKYPQLQLNL
jgi:hypothetical protein